MVKFSPEFLYLESVSLELVKTAGALALLAKGMAWPLEKSTGSVCSSLPVASEEDLAEEVDENNEVTDEAVDDVVDVLRRRDTMPVSSV